MRREGSRSLCAVQLTGAFIGQCLRGRAHTHTHTLTRTHTLSSLFWQTVLTFTLRPHSLITWPKRRLTEPRAACVLLVFILSASLHFCFAALTMGCDEPFDSWHHHVLNQNEKKNKKQFVSLVQLISLPYLHVTFTKQKTKLSLTSDNYEKISCYCDLSISWLWDCRGKTSRRCDSWMSPVNLHRTATFSSRTHRSYLESHFTDLRVTIHCLQRLFWSFIPMKSIQKVFL